MWRLVIKSGLTKGRSWPIESEPLVIGRDKGNGISLRDPLVSRRHCQVSVQDGKVRLCDLSSRNATIVNGSVVSEVILKSGDEITIGNTVFLVSEGDPLPAPAAATSMGRSTVSLSEGEALYLRGDIGDDATGSGMGSVRDLCYLFQWSRRFSKALTEEGLVKSLKQSLLERFTPRDLWLVMAEGAGSASAFRVAFSDGQHPDVDFPEALVRQALLNACGYIVPNRPPGARRSGLQLTLVAPLIVSEQRIGALAIRSDLSHRGYDESDLHCLVALAHVTAPFFAAIQNREGLLEEVKRLRVVAHHLPSLIGSSNAMHTIRERIREVAHSDLPVLIVGETGTGKELVASHIHETSHRARRPFVVVNCAAIPRDLFESEFFGHEKGSFTGAHARRTGLIEQSHRGTLFLDEVGDLSGEHQARILRAIESRLFRRVGGETDLSADFRIISATNSNLLAAIERGTFRLDLYHRLKGILLQIPPLRERVSDIPELADFFFQQVRVKAKRPLRGFDPSAMKFLSEQHWPGNVRELKFAVESAATIGRGEDITADDLARAVGPTAGLSSSDDTPTTLAQAEKQLILKTLARCGGRVMEAAQVLGIGKTKLYERLAHYEAEKRP